MPKLYYFPQTNPAWDTFTNNPAYEAPIKAQCNAIGTFTPFWDAKLSWFPNAWVYCDAYAIYTDPTRNSALVNAHPEWILTDGKGDKLYIPWGCSGGTCPQYAGDVGNPAFQQAMIGQMLQGVVPGYAGIWLDDVDMNMNVGDGTGALVAPQDPRTGKPMTQAAWQTYFVEYLTRIKDALALWDLGLFENAVWYQSTLAQSKTAEYQWVQYGFGDPGITGGTGTFSLSALFSTISAVQSQGTLVVTNDSIANLGYSYACALMAQCGTGYGDGTPDKWTPTFTALTNTDYGAPTAPLQRLEGLWWRTFANGTAYAVEPGGTTVTLALDKPMTDMVTGGTVTSVTLSQRQGVVLQ